MRGPHGEPIPMVKPLPSKSRADVCLADYPLLY
jgi:hypothetical protein